MNRLNRTKQAQVVAALVEGNSIRAIERMTGVAKHTILKLIKDAGIACADYQDRTLRNLKCKRIQVDEIWQFCYAKSRNVPEEKRGIFGYGDVWTWVALDADTKLVPAFMTGNRDAQSARMFIDDLASRLAGRIQLTACEFILRLLKAHLDATSTMRCWLRPMNQAKRKRVTVLRCVHHASATR